MRERECVVSKKREHCTESRTLEICARRQGGERMSCACDYVDIEGELVRFGFD